MRHGVSNNPRWGRYLAIAAFILILIGCAVVVSQGKSEPREITVQNQR